jgi:CheY-like chemotaxis protein
MDMPTPSEPNLILIVDDTPTNIALISALLKAEGYRTKAATSGEKALAVANGEEKPDLILLDVMMPGMDGYQVCEQLKANPSTSDIPVIFLTGLMNPEDEQRGFAAGAADYVYKPFSPAVVRARVKIQLALQQALRELAAERERANGLEAQLVAGGHAG